MKNIWRLSVLLFLVAAPIDAIAHQVFLSSVRIVENPNRQIDVELKVEGSDLEKVFNIPLTIRGGIVNPHVLETHKLKLTEYLRAKFAVSNREGDSCHLVSKETESFF